MKRAAIAFFFDEQGIIDEYFAHLLTSLSPFCATIILVVNGLLTDASRKSVEHRVCQTASKIGSGAVLVKFTWRR